MLLKLWIYNKDKKEVLKCMKCKSAYFCCIECQQSHTEEDVHKSECKSSLHHITSVNKNIVLHLKFLNIYNYYY